MYGFKASDLNRPFRFLCRYLPLSSVITLIAVLTGCAWVKPLPSSEKVALVKPALASDCQFLGHVNVSVKAKVVGLIRKREKVADELIVLAKNEALSLEADTLVAEVADNQGRQRFKAYRCQ